MGNVCFYVGFFEIGYVDWVDCCLGIVWEYVEDVIEVDGVGNS